MEKNFVEIEESFEGAFSEESKPVEAVAVVEEDFDSVLPEEKTDTKEVTVVKEDFESLEHLSLIHI